jgi:hypothetical protein
VGGVGGEGARPRRHRESDGCDGAFDASELASGMQPAPPSHPHKTIQFREGGSGRVLYIEVKLTTSTGVPEMNSHFSK